MATRTMRQAREARRLTQQGLATRAGVAMATVHAVERGVRRPTLETAVRLSRALGARPAEIREFRGVAAAVEAVGEEK